MRVLLVVEIDTDPTPGQFHRDRIVQDLQLLLETQVGHYNPRVRETVVPTASGEMCGPCVRGQHGLCMDRDCSCPDVPESAPEAWDGHGHSARPLYREPLRNLVDLSDAPQTIDDRYGR